jgi:hypothetical protein
LERLKPAVAWNVLNGAQRLNNWNDWNCPQDHFELFNLELWNRRKAFERSEAVERLERLELATAAILPLTPYC